MIIKETRVFAVFFVILSIFSCNTNNDKTISIIANSEAQIYAPVKWTFSSQKTGEKEFELLLKARIEKGWHLYSQNLPNADGPIATSFSFSEDKSFSLVGKVSEPKPVKEYDPNFQMELFYFKDAVTFKQKVKIIGYKTTVKGSLEYMVCDNEKCLPPETVEFEIALDNSVPAETSNIEKNIENNSAKTILKDSIIAETVADSAKSDSSNSQSVTGIPQQVTSDSQKNRDRQYEDEESKAKDSFWGILLAGFLGGLLALLTPCVFPMIPLTVSFFTKQSENKAKGISNAILYGISIIFIYVILGYGITAIFGADALNALSTNVWFNIAFFILLVIFAISFLGAFEITLPSSWINATDKVSDKGGIIGIFFMAFTLSLVSFSCTGPIIGTLLVEAAVNGGVVGPITGMFGFALALALPFGLFAAFPGWLNSLPKSGGWLNSVKVTLGFLELALALKFLSNADLVVQAGFLKREIFLAIWIGIFGALTLYLFGIFRLSHDSEVKYLSVTRVFFAMLSFVFTLYLIPGLWGAPLKIISGFPPPMFYSEAPNGLTTLPLPTERELRDEVVGDPTHCPHNLNCFHDYDEGLAYAKKIGKPVMLDFTGWACVNCRKMEEQVWSDPRVLQRLREDVVLISLYVDEKTRLSESEQIEVKIGEKIKKLKTVGNKWSYFQTSRYETNSQPYYVMIDHYGQKLSKAATYDPDIEKFIGWLDEGRAEFERRMIP